jgi:hypothetical protein
MRRDAPRLVVSRGSQVFKKSFVLGLPLALLAVLWVVPSAGSALLASARVNASSAASFSDAPGDSGVAPDITDVDVGNDVVAGPIVFWVTLANRPDDLVAGDELGIFLDTDVNPATGDLGSEYAIFVQAESLGLFRWDGTTYVFVESASLSARFSTTDKAIRVSIHPSELGALTAFNFAVQSFSGEAFDYAPNGPPEWSYRLTTGRIGLFVVGSAVTPKRPTAGKGLSALLQVGRSDTNEILTLGKVTCMLRIGTKSVRATKSLFVAGLAYCSWKLPSSAKGKLVQGSILVSYGGASVKKSFSVRAR